MSSSIRPAATASVRTAVVLAAGNGDRFRSESPRSKLLTPVGGVPLLLRTLSSARAAGISDAHVVLGYDAERVRALLSPTTVPDMTIYFHLNRRWHAENGLSVLAAQPALGDRPFALLMGDHLFEADVLRRMLDVRLSAMETLLAIDTQPAPLELVAEATKVRMQGDRIVAIGKSIAPHDALDTGMFVCQPSLFRALEQSCADGDTTLSGGIRRLAAQGLVRGVDIGAALWCDVDTTSDLRFAEQIVARTMPT